jgi:hypothetical protein
MDTHGEQRYLTGKFALTVAILSVGFVVGSVAHGAGAPPPPPSPPPPPTCTVSSIQLVGATQGTINDDGSVTEGTSVTLKGVVTESATQVAAPPCDAGIANVAVGLGSLRIQGKVDDSVPPQPQRCPTVGVGEYSDLVTQILPNTNPPGINVATYALNTTDLGGETRGYRTKYGGPTGPNSPFRDSVSVCVDLTINESANPCDAYGDVVVLNVVGGEGAGEVAAGGSGPWTYTFEVLNCTGLDDLAVKVQGGTSGWTNFISAVTNPSETVTSEGKSKGKKGQTSIITWNTLLDDEESKTMAVTVTGTVPLGTPVGTSLNISGAWSAAYHDGASAAKSDYTPGVYVEVIAAP